MPTRRPPVLDAPGSVARTRGLPAMTGRGTAERAAMVRALELAATPGVPLGPNPRVGCVLLAPDGTTVAEGFHRGAGTPHAEADALARAGDRARGRHRRGHPRALQPHRSHRAVRPGAGRRRGGPGGLRPGRPQPGRRRRRRDAARRGRRRRGRPAGRRGPRPSTGPGRSPSSTAGRSSPGSSPPRSTAAAPPPTAPRAGSARCPPAATPTGSGRCATRSWSAPARCWSTTRSSPCATRTTGPCRGTGSRCAR